MAMAMYGFMYGQSTQNASCSGQASQLTGLTCAGRTECRRLSGPMYHPNADWDGHVQQELGRILLNDAALHGYYVNVHNQHSTADFNYYFYHTKK